MWHDLYPQRCLEATVNDYKDFCEVKQTQANDDFSVIDVDINPEYKEESAQILRGISELPPKPLNPGFF